MDKILYSSNMYRNDIMQACENRMLCWQMSSEEGQDCRCCTGNQVGGILSTKGGEHALYC